MNKKSDQKNIGQKIEQKNRTPKLNKKWEKNRVKYLKEIVQKNEQEIVRKHQRRN